MLAFILPIFMRDLSDINAVVKKPVDMRGIPFSTRTCPSLLGSPALCPVSLPVELMTGRRNLDLELLEAAYFSDQIYTNGQKRVIFINTATR